MLIKETKEMRDIPVKESPQYYFIDMYYVLYFISVFFKTKVQILERTSENRRLVVKFVINKDLEIFREKKFDKTFNRMLSMPKKTLMAYLNSCSAFHSALSVANNNYSVAFVLLVISIESLSNKYYSEGRYGKKFERFMNEFIPENKRFLPSELRYIDKKLTKKETNALFKKLLKSVYGRVRSGFSHFGEQSPISSMLADRFKLAYIKTSNDDEVFNPSFGWFKRLVEEVLINFLFSQEIKEYNDLHSLLSERFIERLKAKRVPIKKGQLLTPQDVYLQ